MEIENQILFFLAGLGVFNGFLLATYFLFIIKPKRWINILFGLLMLMLCIRIGKSLFHVFTDLDRIYRQIGLSACIMIGPLLFLYVRSCLSPVVRPVKSDWVHLLSPFVSIIIIGLIWPYETFPEVWNKYLVKLIYALWFLYLLGSCRLLAPFVKKVFQQKSTIIESWLLLVVSSILLICITYILAYGGYALPYLSGSLIFSVVFYVLTGFLLSKNRRSIIIQEKSGKYQNQKISTAKADELLNRLSDMMQTQEPYLNHKIKLAQIAKSIDSSPHEVSQVINNRLGISFNHYINEFRIRKACALLKEADHLTIEGIGHEVGFNSRSAFYKAFKSIMKQTPLKYKSQVKHSGE